MSGAIGILAASLTLLACMITISSGQSCHDVTCCLGKVCVEESTPKGLKNRTKCVYPTSCDQLNCSAGLTCSKRNRGGVHCQPTCANVHCAEPYTCREKHSRTECVWESSVNCTGVQCPQGTTCHLLKNGRKEHTVCLGKSCSAMNCSDGTQCYNGKRLTSANSKRNTIIVETKEGNATVSLKTLRTKAIKKPTKYAKGARLAANEQDIGICLPTCEGTHRPCPEGLVCHNKNHKITCRSPRSCKEVNCGPHQQCTELQCTRHKPNHPLHTQATSPPPPPSGKKAGKKGQSPTKKSNPSHRHIILQCVDTGDSATENASMATTENATMAATNTLE